MQITFMWFPWFLFMNSHGCTGSLQLGSSLPPVVWFPLAPWVPMIPSVPSVFLVPMVSLVAYVPPFLQFLLFLMFPWLHMLLEFPWFLQFVRFLVPGISCGSLGFHSSFGSSSSLGSHGSEGPMRTQGTGVERWEQRKTTPKKLSRTPNLFLLASRGFLSRDTLAGYGHSLASLPHPSPQCWLLELGFCSVLVAD